MRLRRNRSTKRSRSCPAVPARRCPSAVGGSGGCGLRRLLRGASGGRGPAGCGRLDRRVKRHSKLTPWRHRKLTPEETAYVDGSAGSEGLSADDGFRAGRWCWSCRTGVPSRDGTAWLSRTVWSTTTQWKGRSVERQPECRGRLVWRTRRRWDGRCRWLRQACLEAALSRARTTSGWALTLGRARILRSAKPGQTGALVCGRTSRWLIEILRMNVVPVSVIDDDRCGDTSTAPL